MLSLVFISYLYIVLMAHFSFHNVAFRVSPTRFTSLLPTLLRSSSPQFTIDQTNEFQEYQIALHGLDDLHYSVDEVVESFKGELHRKKASTSYRSFPNDVKIKILNSVNQRLINLLNSNVDPLSMPSILAVLIRQLGKIDFQILGPTDGADDTINAEKRFLELTIQLYDISIKQYVSKKLCSGDSLTLDQQTLQDILWMKKSLFKREFSIQPTVHEPPSSLLDQLNYRMVLFLLYSYQCQPLSDIGREMKIARAILITDYFYYIRKSGVDVSSEAQLMKPLWSIILDMLDLLSRDEHHDKEEERQLSQFRSIILGELFV